FDNPAAMVMLFKNGRPNGYTWLFLNPEAQKIVGQPHPEVNLIFENYRRKDESADADNLYNYEVKLRITEKGSHQDFGDVWLSAGQIRELPVSEKILQSANIRMDRLPDTHGARETTSTQVVDSSATTGSELHDAEATSPLAIAE